VKSAAVLVQVQSEIHVIRKYRDLDIHLGFAAISRTVPTSERLLEMLDEIFLADLIYYSEHSQGLGFIWMEKQDISSARWAKTQRRMPFYATSRPGF
jgi:hypothetical protein